MIADPKIFSTVIKDITTQSRPSASYVVIPERHVYVKSFDVSAASGDLDETIRWEASQHIPFDLSELYLDWDSAGSKDRQSVTSTAAPRSVVDQYVEAIERSGLPVLSVESGSTAAFRLIPASKNVSKLNAMLLNLGESESSALLIEENLPAFTASVLPTTAQLEKALQKEFSLSPGDAHEARILLGFSEKRASGFVRKILLEQLTMLTNRVLEIINYQQEHSTTHEVITEIFTIGPGAETVGLEEILTERTGLKVSPITVPLPAVLGRKAKSFSQSFQYYALAYSAALRRLDA